MQPPARASIDHTPGRPQGWNNVDPDIGRWVNGISSLCQGRLSTVGVYLHGSLAMGTYFRPKSDVDLLVVVDETPSESDRRALAVGLLATFEARPTIGGVELSVVHRRHVDAFEHPLPYEFHFSEKWADDIRGGGCGPRGTDRDLAAHCAMARARGLALCGEEPAAVIGPVPESAFVDAIMDDFDWIVGGGILESPFYGVLNVCRVLKGAAGGSDRFVSKDEGGAWALEHLPEEHRPIVRDALECYRSSAGTPADQRQMHGHGWDEGALTALADYARQIVHRGRLA